MEHINPYAVMRNTATHEAYKAYNREAMKAGRFLFLGIFLPPIWLPIEMIVARRFDHPMMADLPLFSAFVFGPAVLSALLVLIGGLQMRRFRREHPIPEEWRQVPRVRWPVPAQKPRLPQSPA